jgi:hypothetical protein
LINQQKVGECALCPDLAAGPTLIDSPPAESFIGAMSADQPSWLGQPHAVPVQMDMEAQQQQQQQQQQHQTAQPSTAYRRCVKITFFCINMGFMVMESAAGVLGIGSAQGISDSSTVIVGLYMFLFAVILGLYEVIQVWPVNAVDTFYKKNFGFLYRMAGKCIFLVFMAVLCFGLVTPNTSNASSTNSISTGTTTTPLPANLNIQTQAQQLAVGTGVLVSLWGIIQYIVWWKLPWFFDEKTQYRP